jgi:hypothetical protein
MSRATSFCGLGGRRRGVLDDSGFCTTSAKSAPFSYWISVEQN